MKRRALAPRFDELRAASQALVIRPEFAGAEHCRGCAYIEGCSEGGVSANWDDWRSAGAAANSAGSGGAIVGTVPGEESWVQIEERLDQLGASAIRLRAAAG